MKKHTIYIWHSSDKACEKCQKLDGKIFNSIEEIPDPPHPNCKCWIEDKEQEEDLCDCWEKSEKILNKINELSGEIKSIKEELNAYKNDIEYEINNFNNKLNEIEQLKEELYNTTGIVTGGASFIENYPSKSYSELYNTGYEAIDFIEAGFKVYDIFESNYKLSAQEKGTRDKYYHSKANCESAELGAIEAFASMCMSILKELYDIYRKVGKQHQDFKKVAQDCWQDLEADFMGLKEAKQKGKCETKVLEVEEYFKRR